MLFFLSIEGVCVLLAVILMAMTILRLKNLIRVLKIDSMAVNQSFAAAHTLLFLIYAQYSVF